MSLQIPILGDLTGLQAALRNVPGMVGNALQQANIAGRAAFGGLFGGLRATVNSFSGFLKSSLVNAVGAVGIVQSFRSTIQQLDRVGDLSERFGVNAEALQRLGGVAELSGANMESMAKALSRLGRTIVEAVQDPASEAAGKFERLGLNIDEIKNKRIDEVFLTIADKISSLASETEQGALAFDFFGKAGDEIRNVIMMNADEIERFAEGVSIASNEAVAAAQEIDDAMTGLGQSFTGVMSSMLMAFRPTILFVLDGLEQMTALARIAVEAVKSIFSGQGLSSPGLVAANQAFQKTVQQQRTRRISSMTDEELAGIVAGSDKSDALLAKTELDKRNARKDFVRSINERNLAPLPQPQGKSERGGDSSDVISRNIESILSSGRGIEAPQIIADSLAKIGGGGGSVIVGGSDREQQRLLTEQLNALKKIEKNTASDQVARLK